MSVLFFLLHETRETCMIKVVEELQFNEGKHQLTDWFCVEITELLERSEVTKYRWMAHGQDAFIPIKVANKAQEEMIGKDFHLECYERYANFSSTNVLMICAQDRYYFAFEPFSNEVFPVDPLYQILTLAHEIEHLFWFQENRMSYQEIREYVEANLQSIHNPFES